ncbi:MAG: helix-turn-helix transcriptional regulator [Methylovirgula sp.]|jgi:hypothetical protein
MENRIHGGYESDVFQEVKRLFLEEKLPAREITARLQGRGSYSTVRTYIRMIIEKCQAEGLPLPTVKAQKPHKILSELHHIVGLRILHHRMVEMGGMTPREYASEFGIGNQLTIQVMEHGKYEFTLSELTRIADAIGQSLVELVTSPSAMTTAGVRPPSQSVGGTVVY